ncbi:uncharacterized protein LOC143735699 isoform X2 [Siphateles boraxobius]|uniref:uncharacterized protein LOC143735699 isoform X2 n=1 Tax=Siphateles boraxobius TaxID=180520 RepID=UPI0040642834
MKKGSLNFLGRKNQSLFATNVEFKEMDNVELVLDSTAIPESGTAKVRSRPTVKHFTASESVQGFAVPTPKVPILPPVYEPKINGTGSTTNLPKERMLSVPDIIEGEILIPPPPCSAPPPPPPSSAPRPPSFIPLPPQYFSEIDPSVKHSSLQPPPMAPPKPPSNIGSKYSSDLDMAFLKPPPMAPPKPPSETSSIRGTLSSLEVKDIPECPKFTPPPPPGGKTPPVLAKSPKAAPLKPIRTSSVSNLDIQSQMPTPPVASNPRLSSFNPRNTANLYNVQKTGQSDKEQVQSILLLEDSSGNSVGVVNGNSGKNGGPLQPVQSVVPPTKPARRNSSATQLENNQPDMPKVPSQPAKVEVKVNPEPVMVQNIPIEVPTPINVSPRIEKKIPDVTQVMESPSRSRRYSPVVNHRQLNTQGVDGTVKKDTSPFALLLAAKERDKQRTALSQKNSNSTEPSNSVIQPSVEKPNSFTVSPRNPTPDSPNAQLKSTTNVQPLTTAEVTKVSHSKPELSSTPQQSTPMNSSVGGLGVPVRDVESGENLTFIPPPPEFANSDTEDEPSVPTPSYLFPAPLVKTASQPSKTLPATPTPIINCPPPSHPAPAAPVKTTSQLSKTLPAIPTPIINCPPPSHPAPAAPVKTAPAPAKPYLPTQIPNVTLLSHSAPPAPPTKPSPPATPPPVTNGPRVSPKPKPPTYPPKAPGPPPNLQLQSKPVQTKATQPPSQGPPSVTASQATLLSILQKKMLEMDPKFSAVKEVESNGDDWNSPLSDDEAPSYPPKTKSATLPVQSRGLDLKELESKAAKKALATSAKSQNSNGSSSKQPYGMTFIVRPGTQQPITPVFKDGSP